jgi:hypothetical protein
VSECGGFTAAAPGVPNIQPVKPASKKKTMSAIVATAKLRSARRNRSHPFIDCLAFILICSRVSDRSDNAHAPSPTRLPILSAPASSTPWVNPILAVCPNLLEFGFRFLQKHRPELAFLSAVAQFTYEADVPNGLAGSERPTRRLMNTFSLASGILPDSAVEIASASTAGPLTP